jgi:hypothetical protein
MLMGIRRRGERANACLKVLVNAAASLTSLAPEAISAPSAGHASSLAEIAGPRGQHEGSFPASTSTWA